jgi:hypothetical protein
MALNTNHAHREDETRHFINPQSGDKAERKSAAFGFTAVFVLFAKIYKPRRTNLCIYISKIMQKLLQNTHHGCII